MSAKKGVVAFDFDGVIADTVRENYVQALKAYAGLEGKFAEGKRAKKAFHEARPLLTKIDHYFTIMRMIEQNPGINFKKMTQKQFDAEYAKDSVKAAEFTKRFYDYREQMKTSSPRKWLALQGAYPKIAKFVAKIQQKNQVFIATTKDKKTVVKLLAEYGIRIPKENILSREFSKDKKQHLQEIARRAGVSVKDVVLVEDAVKQLRDVGKIGVKGTLVRWGYSTKAQRKQAKREGVPIIRKANIFGRMKIRKLQRRAGK